DGIMSAIDFDMQIERLPNPKGDRVKITMSGKFLPYKYYGNSGNVPEYGYKEEGALASRGRSLPSAAPSVRRATPKAAFADLGAIERCHGALISGDARSAPQLFNRPHSRSCVAHDHKPRAPGTVAAHACLTPALPRGSARST